MSNFVEKTSSPFAPRMNGPLSRRAFAKGALISGVALGMAPLAFSSAAKALPQGGGASVNALHKMISEQLLVHNNQVALGANALEIATQDDTFHDHLGMQLHSGFSVNAA